MALSSYLPVEGERRKPCARTLKADRTPPARRMIALEIIGSGRWIFWVCKNTVISRMMSLDIQKYVKFCE
jgi:hypothetical protein